MGNAIREDAFVMLDFTDRRVGSQAHGFRIVRCPVCGKPGLLCGRQVVHKAKKYADSVALFNEDSCVLEGK